MRGKVCEIVSQPNESVEIAKAIVHALPMGEDVDEGEVVAEVLKAFVVDEPRKRTKLFEWMQRGASS